MTCMCRTNPQHRQYKQYLHVQRAEQLRDNLPRIVLTIDYSLTTYLLTYKSVPTYLLQAEKLRDVRVISLPGVVSHPMHHKP